MSVRTLAATALAVILTSPFPATAQSSESSGWHVMQDAVVYGLFNHQGGPRGGREVRIPNWWMGMFSRKVGTSNLTLNTMLSVDPLVRIAPRCCWKLRGEPAGTLPTGGSNSLKSKPACCSKVTPSAMR